MKNIDIKLTDTFECPECLYLESPAAVGFAQGPCGSCRSNPRPVLPPALADDRKDPGDWLIKHFDMRAEARAKIDALYLRPNESICVEQKTIQKPYRI